MKAFNTSIFLVRYSIFKSLNLMTSLEQSCRLLQRRFLYNLKLVSLIESFFAKLEDLKVRALLL